MALRTVGVRLTADVSQYMSNMKRAGAATKDLTGELGQAAKGGHLDRVADRAAVVGIGLAGAAGAAVKMRMDFDKAMSGVQAATHAGTGEIEVLRKAALQAGKDTSYSATEAAGAITELSKAGVSTADILGGGLKGALSLAAAGQLDVGEAAETAASAMTQFKLSGKDIPHISDLLAAGAGKAQGSVHDMGMALSQSGLVASQFGLSIEDTTGTLAAFASAGLIGSDSGTSFKTMLLALANPASKTKDAMDELGISAYDASGKFVGITNLADQLKNKLGGLTQAQRDQTLAQIFGTDAIRAANVLYQQGGAGIQDWIDKTNDAGYAAKTAAALTDNLAGDIERLKGSIETLAIESGGGATGGLRALTKGTSALVAQFDLLPSGITGTVTVLAALGGATALGAAGWVKMRRSTADALEELRSTGPAGDKAAVGLQKTTKWAGRAAVAFAAAQVAAAGVNAAFGSDINPQIDALGQNLDQWAKNGTKSGEAARLLGDNFQHLSYDLGTLDSGFWTGLGNGISGVTESFTGLGGVMDESLQHAKERLAAIDGTLQSMVQNGQSQQAAAIFSKLAEEAKKSGVSVDELKKGLPGYASSLQTAGTAAGGLATATAAITAPTESATDATEKFSTVTDAAASAARGERDALVALSNFMKAQIDPVFGFIDSQKALAKAQQDAAQAQKDLDKAIDKHGPKSKEAKDASDKLRASTRNLADAAVDLQGKTGALGDTFNGKLSPQLVDTFKKAGLTDAQIKNLTGQFKNAKVAADKYTGSYAAKVSAPGVVESKIRLNEAWAAAKGYDGTYTAKLTISGNKVVDQKLADLLIKQRALASGLSLPSAAAAVQKDLDRNRQKGYDAGGWTGPGDMYDVAGVVHADEHVIRKSSRRRLEAARPGALDYMNETGSWPGYVLGGRATMTFPTNVSKTKIPQPSFSAPGGAGGPGYKWMEAVVRAAFPGMPIYSDYRPGAITLTGNKSYHGFGRAVDFAPSLPLAEWINLHFMRATKELITPWQSLNIHNGQRHHYSALIENQHNFAGGNAHDHWAMKNGGTITEPVFGVGASGRTYSFGENYRPERVSPMWQSAGGGGGSMTIVLENRGVIASPMEAENWLAAGVDNLRRKGKL